MLRTTAAPDVTPESPSRKLFQGICIMYVEAISPSKEEFDLMGIKLEKEPVYRGEKNLRIDFWLKNDEHDIRVKLPIWVSLNLSEPTKENKVSVINQHGQTGLIPGDNFRHGNLPDNFKDWFKLPYIQAKEGERELRDFVSSWTNQTKEKAIVTINFVEICKGNLKSLFDIVGSERDTAVKVFLGVREGKYQAAYRNVFAKWQSDVKVHKAASSDKNTDFGIVNNYLEEVKLREYVPTGSPVPSQITTANTVRPEYQSSIQLPPGVPQVAGAEHDEDLPF